MCSKSLLIAFLIATSINCQTKGCFQWNSFTNSCSLCFRRKRTIQGNCGALLPDNDPCLIHTESAGSKTTICALCAPDYALELSTGACKPVKIFNCVKAQIVGGAAKCLACKGGEFPTNDGKLCVPNAIDDCVWAVQIRPATNAIRDTCLPMNPRAVLVSKVTPLVA